MRVTKVLPWVQLRYSRFFSIPVCRYPTTSRQSVTVSYIGAAGRRLLRGAEYVEPNPDLSFVYVTRNAGLSRSITRRRSIGVPISTRSAPERAIVSRNSSIWARP